MSRHNTGGRVVLIAFISGSSMGTYVNGLELLCTYTLKSGGGEIHLMSLSSSILMRPPDDFGRLLN